MLVGFGLTDTGCQRELNEDRILVDLSYNVFVVADGMGGQRCGERAAETAVQSVKSYFQMTAGRKEITWPFGYDASIALIQNLMVTAIKLANRKVWRDAESAAEYTGMGSTVAAVYIAGDKAIIGSVGDSRVYHYRGKTLRLLTKDDSLIARLIETGAITLAEAATHPMRSVLTEAVGAKENINVQIHEVHLIQGDRLMLTSDGVHGVIEDTVLRGILDSGDDIQTLVKNVVKEARDRGGPDNISCIVVEYKDEKGRTA
jgi:serine/threonine protein phosphatase PrpC